MRKIIHIDMDCFYAAVETRENPQFIGKPIAVGGRPESRGVVATCNYEARKFGVHSAMPMSQALKKCPQLIMLGVNMSLYQSISRKIQTMFKEYSPLVQPLSLDEAFIDVSDCQLHKGSATLIAQAIRKRIYEEHQLTASAGIAPNKFLAKIASDWNKPNGQFVVTPNEIDAFVIDLPVKKIFGVGKVTNQKMQKLGIHTCRDLQSLSKTQLHDYFGKFGDSLFSLCRGIDDRPVRTDSFRKSLSVEDTFIRDRQNLGECLVEVEKLYQSLLPRLDRCQQKKTLPIKALYIKLRFNNFKTTTAQLIATKPDIYSYKKLVEIAWNRGKRPVRLIGLGIQFEDEEKMDIQLKLPI
jgi:DNA polymerase-4